MKRSGNGLGASGEGAPAAATGQRAQARIRLRGERVEECLSSRAAALDEQIVAGAVHGSASREKYAHPHCSKSCPASKKMIYI